MKKDRNRKNLNTKAFAAAAVLGVGAVAAASFAAYSRTMANLTPTTSADSTSVWTFSAPESVPANAEQSGVERDDAAATRPSVTTAPQAAECSVPGDRRG